MSLAAGARLNCYEIVGSLGAGGMGEVYRAGDTRLQRDVALKVLPATLASDPDHIERSLLLTHRDQRIHLEGAPRWHIARQARDGEERQQDHGIRHWIGRRDAPQRTLDQLCQ